MDTQTINQELFSYIKQSPTPFHAVASAAALLSSHGFTQLLEQDIWDLQPGGKYFITRGKTSIFAFRMPATPVSKAPSFQIIASHSDSPCFKLKNPSELTVDEHYTKLNVEKYGGALLAPWFDRPLSLAGRVILKKDDNITSTLVDIDRDLAMIVNLAIHMNHSANDGYAYHVQTDLLPIIGSGQKQPTVRSLVAKELGVEESTVLSSDLSLYNRMDGRLWGAENEFLSAPRLDNLQCAHASIKALLGPCHPDILCGAAIFDTEEVGSHSPQGACSTFLKDCLKRISYSLGFTSAEHLQALAGSFLVSADNGHALHPNYPGKSDPTHHPYLNGGVLIKYAANLKYTSDALTGGLFQLLCEQHDIPCQSFFNHSDEAGGSTLGNLAMSQVSIPCVDIGVSMLAMHSPYETVGAKDNLWLYQAMAAFYQTKVYCTGDGSYRLIPS
ncbi:MAG: M18 family aminopeptidase [Clostridia bacterium]|nr:M18 family aminopeptidase [Clostridia bacterium]NCC43005.1 M18 family aminopeptidase [Clostridia bacterium]